MKRTLCALLIAALLSSCGVQIRSVVDKSVTGNPYVNPLIVIPYENGVTRNFSNQIREKLEARFRTDNRRIEIILVEQKLSGLTLNASANIDSQINEVLSRDKKDLILIFRPTHLQFYNNGLQSATYLITATELTSRREVWKAEFTSSSTFGPSMFAEKAATAIYEKLKTDGVI